MQNIVFLGDSLTHGYGTYPEYAFPYVVAQKLNIHAINKGENGDFTCGMSARFRNDVLNCHPDAVMILGGTNDILNAVSLNSTMNYIDEMVQSAHMAGIQVFLGIPMAPDKSQMLDFGFSAFKINRLLDRFENFHQQLLDYCTKNQIPCIDFYEKYPEHLFMDGVHPTAKGYEIMADIFINTIKPSDN